MKNLLMHILTVFCATALYAQPSTITYQGILTDDTGDLITGTENIKFDIYSVVTSGSSLWTETHSSVAVNKGLFNVELGSVTPFGSLDFSQDLWLEITVDGTTLTPRIAFNSSGYAKYGEISTNLAGGAEGSIPYQSAENTTDFLSAGTDGQVLTLTGGLPDWADANESDPTFSSSLASEITTADTSWWGNKYWQKNDDDNLFYYNGKVAIGVDIEDEDEINAPLNVEGGIQYLGGTSLTNVPGLMYYEPADDGTFRFIDNNGDVQVLGTGTINYTGTLWELLNSDLTSDDRDVLCNVSLGVGVDITPGTNFGFSTILLKENNLRITFEDTSVGSFPSNDWQLTANSSAIGGDNYFAIEDISNATIPFLVRDNAPSFSMYIAGNGNLGLGTQTPQRDIHIINGDNPAIRLEQDGSLWPAYIWDIKGNENIFFITDVSNSGLIPFKIESGAPSNSIYIKDNGNIGLGTMEPARKIHISGLMRLEPTSAPADPGEGDIYYDAVTHKLRCYDGTVWNDLW